MSDNDGKGDSCDDDIDGDGVDSGDGVVVLVVVALVFFPPVFY